MFGIYTFDASLRLGYVHLISLCVWCILRLVSLCLVSPFVLCLLISGVSLSLVSLMSGLYVWCLLSGVSLCMLCPYIWCPLCQYTCLVFLMSGVSWCLVSPYVWDIYN